MQPLQQSHHPPIHPAANQVECKARETFPYAKNKANVCEKREFRKWQDLTKRAATRYLWKN